MYGCRNHSYYVLKVDECRTPAFALSHDIWVRITGFSESDIKIFIDYIIKQGLTIDEFKSMIYDWCIRDSMFNELDWDCLIEGYISGDLKKECYISWSKLAIVTSVATSHMRPEDVDIYMLFFL